MSSTPKRYAVLIDLRRCIGCQTCSVACKSTHDVPLGVWRTWVKQIEKGTYPHVTKSFLPLLCNQCENPVCATVCPTKASYRREDGIVLINPHLCIGCRYCMAACPYDVRYVNPLKKIVQKCDFCVHRIDAGLAPACVEACPVGAMLFGDMHDPASEIARLVATHPIQVVKPEMATKPHVFYINADLEVMDAKGGAPWKSQE